MNFKLQLVAVTDEGRDATVQEITLLHKDGHSIENLGLTLAESKQILKEVQSHIVEQQVAACLITAACCRECGTPLSMKGYHTITFRTLFGNLVLNSPRLRHCSCSPHDTASFSPLVEIFTERTSPELLYIEAKWASLVSYGMTVKALQDFLPVDEKTNAATVRNHTLKVAQRCEAELGEEQVFFIEGCPHDWEALPEPEGPITVGIDGGYLRSWEKKKTNFEVIVGKSVPTDGAAKCFGLVQSYDEKPKRRLFELLTSQGMQMNQDVYFMSDGEEAVRQLQLHLNPRSEHLLDWFHITMRITVLGQYVKGLLHLDQTIGEQLKQALELTKWNLWHGKVARALERFMEVEKLMWHVEESYPKFTALKKAVSEFQGYIERNREMIKNYGEYWREGRAISTAFVESLVNSLLGKRFRKKQQMQWTKRGAHLLLQTRSKMINQELATTFCQWYPGFGADQHSVEQDALAA